MAVLVMVETVRVSDLIRKSYTKAPKSLTICFAILFLAISGLMIPPSKDEYDHKVYIRDHGVSTYGIVTKKYTESSVRSGPDYYIDYTYRPLGQPAMTLPISSERHEVSSDNYSLYNVGAKIPTKYDPRNPQDTHLDVQGYWSNGRLAVSSALQFALLDTMIGVIVLGVWWFSAFLYDIFFGPVKNLTPPAQVALRNPETTRAAIVQGRNPYLMD
jgi:Protein of unknown function (DUF3592)